MSDLGDLQGVLTTKQQAEQFVATGINWLAPAFGNVHGNYGPKGPQLEWDRLQGLIEKVGDRVHFVLHGAGTRWFKEEMLRKVVDAGVVKINLNDAVNDTYKRVMGEKAENMPLTQLLELVTNEMQKDVEKHMDWLGSSGKAW